MAHNFKLAARSVDAAADVVCARLNGGTLRIYDGAQPSSPDAPVTGHRLLAECTFGNPAFAPAVGGVAAAEPLTDEESAPATGTATWFRAVTASGQAVFDGSVGVATADLVLGTVSIALGTMVVIDRMTYTQPKT